MNIEPEKTIKLVDAFAKASLIVAVVATPVASEKIPPLEQTLSAGAVCLALLNAALASGWGANWLTGPMATDAPFMRQGLRLKEGEYIAGFLHIGTPSSAPPERPRPDLAQKTQWVRT